ncbi:lanthionine synthetase C family protein [Kitasatospora sp. NPDC059088]|uniref:lanthionine synthetase C family protein n=1 Tax=Kitasatospora sp. NPDC059088 TaxID=3346722 RepID=UPI00368C778D
MHTVRETGEPSVRTPDAPLAERVRDTVRLVVSRTATTEQWTELALRAADQAAVPMGWYPPSLSHGQAGLALLHLYAARAGLGDREHAHGHIREAVLATQVEPLSGPGLFGGTAGLALALADCAEDEPRFRPSLLRLYDQLAEQAIATPWPEDGQPISDTDYDLVNGAAGVLTCLSALPEPGPRVREAAAVLLDRLIRQAGPAEPAGTARGWLLRPEVYPPVGDHHRQYPHGYLNLGVSHGVPGVAVALAAAWAAGHRRPGQREALTALTGWLLGHRLTDDQGPLWANGVPVDELGAERPVAHCHDQLAWCYGTAGIAAALLAVADCTGDDGLRVSAVEAFEAALRRAAGAEPRTPTLCHGLAGLVMLAEEFGPHSAAAAQALPGLLERLLAYAAPRHPVVFADEDLPGNTVDDPGLLSGAAGVALALLAALADERPAWFRVFLGR